MAEGLKIFKRGERNNVELWINKKKLFELNGGYGQIGREIALKCLEFP